MCLYAIQVSHKWCCFLFVLFSRLFFAHFNASIDFALLILQGHEPYNKLYSLVLLNIYPPFQSIMNNTTYNGPGIRQWGSKKTGDPVPAVVPPGGRNGLETGGHLLDVGNQASGGSRVTGDGFGIRQKDKAAKEQSGDENNVELVYDHSNGNFGFSDRIRYNVGKCNRKNCSCCERLVILNFVRSRVTNKRIALDLGWRGLDCNSKRIVYLLTCKHCGIQYVGQTKRKIKARLTEHIRNIKNNKLNTLIVKHFNEKEHNINNMTVQIIDFIEDDNIKLTQVEDF